MSGPIAGDIRMHPEGPEKQMGSFPSPGVQPLAGTEESRSAVQEETAEFSKRQKRPSKSGTDDILLEFEKDEITDFLSTYLLINFICFICKNTWREDTVYTHKPFSHLLVPFANFSIVQQLFTELLPLFKIHYNFLL